MTLHEATHKVLMYLFPTKAADIEKCDSPCDAIIFACAELADKERA